MTNDPLKPWSFASLVDVLLVMWVLFIGGIGIFMLVMIPGLDVALATKALILVSIASAVGGAASTLMWSRCWRQVQWQVGFWEFVAGPAPEYQEALRAWRWGRRFRFCWIMTLAAMGAVVLSETLAGHW